MRKVLTIIVSLLAIIRLHAQDKAPDFESFSLEDLLNVNVTTVSRNAQRAGEAPATVLVITAEQMRTRGYRNIAAVLNDLPDFFVNDKSDPQFYNPVSTRGIFRQDFFVILLDGVRISSPTNEPLPLLENLPIYLAKQIEVVYGPGSALYGADALAGVINIITDKEKTSNIIKANTLYGSQGYHSGNLYLNQPLKNNFQLTVAGQFTYDAQPDFSKIYPEAYNITSHRTGIFNSSYGPMQPQQPITPRYEAPLQSHNIYTSLTKDGLHLKLLHHYAQVPTSTTLKPDNGVYNKDVFYGQGVTTASMEYNDSIGNVRSQTSLVSSTYKVNPHSNYRNLYGGMSHGYKFSRSGMQKIEQQLQFAVSSQVQLTGGATYELFQAVPKTPELQSPMNQRYAVNGTLLNSTEAYNPGGIQANFFSLFYNNIGAYVQSQWSAGKIAAVTAGLRYDHNSRFGSTWNPRIGMVLHPSQNTTIKTMYGTAYWAPSPMISFETYGSFYSADSGRTYRSSFLHLPNPNLKPVTSQSAEISISQHIGKNFQVTVTGYHTTMDGLINTVADNGNTNLYTNEFLGWPADYIEVPFNQGRQETYGGNVLANAMFQVGTGRWNAWASVSYVDGRVEEVVNSNKIKKTELPLIANMQSRVGVDGKYNRLQFSARLQVVSKQRVAGYQDSNNPFTRQTIPGYALLNGSISWSINEFLSVFVNVENALDQRYKNPLDANLDDMSAPAFSASYQDPLRVMAGLRFSLEK